MISHLLGHNNLRFFVVDGDGATGIVSNFYNPYVFTSIFCGETVNFVYAPTGKGSNELFPNDVFAKGTGGVLEESDSYGPILIYIILGLGAIAFLALLGGALYRSQRNRSTP